MAKHREADEAGSGAPFEGALLFRHSPRFEERDELLPELGSTAIELASIADVDTREADMTGWPCPSQDGPDEFMLNTA